MESPSKRLRPSKDRDSGHRSDADDFLSLEAHAGDGNGDANPSKYGYGKERDDNDRQAPSKAPRGPSAQYQRDARFDRRHAQDRPKSKHALPGQEPWVLVKTRFGRQFVHNTETRQSFWGIPKDIWPAVRELGEREGQQKERDDNAKWAEEELQKMRQQSKAENVNTAANVEEGRSRRRRSESLQREDEAAMMAELAAQAEQAEERDVKDALTTIEPQAGETGYDSEGSYEYVEVTDDEDEEDAVAGERRVEDRAEIPDEATDAVEGEEEHRVEFGEDDIAYQLAAMGADYGLDEGEYGEPPEGGWEEGAEGLPISDEDAANLFKDLLDDYRISPYTPWDRLIADESEASILNDDRYTVLPNMKARRQVFDDWARGKAAQIKEERANMEKRDPRIPYLAFLSERATPKLYWPEFRRKFKKESEMNDRKLSDKERERLYRDHINRLKLAESTRKADLMNLLKTIPLRELNNCTTLDSLPQRLLSHLHFISLPSSIRNPIINTHLSSLPAPPEADDLTDQQMAQGDKKRAEKQRREDALAERQRQVEAVRRKTEKEERFARRELLEEEEELRKAMAVGNKGLRAQLAGIDN
ncbi:hypothetical protein B0A50_04266 [Salinomyces thailandicus]|uniref:WW domain-containing protein n=1 Tax=Salinomyces thailandicus TaxID=706561 RepID=A0A4U0TWN2_9PEZI|nr:hypothetical protein B0A50_04266 [Salinomyces thailandica]